MLRDDLLARFPRLRRLPADSYLVGGAIRDLLLGRNPKDVDVAVDHPLDAAEAIGGRIIRLGQEELRAYRVIADDRAYDVAAIERGSIENDLRRRDFTMNAIAVRLSDGQVLDPFNGRDDLRSQRVRMVDSANFDDDPLRVLRAVRLAVTFDFTIEPATITAASQRAARIADVAAERVTTELLAALDHGKGRRVVELLHELHLDEPLFGRQLDPALIREDPIPPPVLLALIVDDPREYGERWRWSEELIRQVATLKQLESHGGDLRVALYDAGAATGGMLPALLRARGNAAKAEVVEAILRGPLFEIRALLSGKEIAEIASLEEGRALGELKRTLLEAQIRGEISSREEAISFVRERA